MVLNKIVVQSNTLQTAGRQGKHRFIETSTICHLCVTHPHEITVDFVLRYIHYSAGIKNAVYTVVSLTIIHVV